MYLSEGKFRLSVVIFFMLLFDWRMLLISLKRLIEVDKFEENSIQASFSVIVQMDVEENSIKLKKLKSLVN